MKRLFFTFALIASVSCSQAVNDFKVVPHPNQVEITGGVFNVAGASVNYDESMSEASIDLVKKLACQLSTVTGRQSEVQVGYADEGFSFIYDTDVAPEAYELEVTPSVVKVTASSLRGFNYAIQTIKQMLPVEVFGNEVAKVKWTMPCAKIVDQPRFGYRGLHLDESRHFFGMDEVKRYLDIMEVHKLNPLHWHLTDDQGWRIEIKKYPELTTVGAMRSGTCIKKDFSTTDGIPYGEGMFYTQDQIREVIAYAAAKGIDIIPEIDLPGHMLAALAAYPELGCTGGPYAVWTRWGVSNDVLCAGNPKVYEFLKDVLDEVCGLFPAEYIHIGGDECPKVSWEKCPKCQAKIRQLGLKDQGKHKAEHFLQSHVMMEMEKFLTSKGKKVIGWDEILEGEIGPDAVVMSWRGEAGGLEAVRLGHDAIMTPNTYYYLDYYQAQDIANEPFGIGGYLPVEKCYSYEPYVDGMTDEEKSHIKGVQANLWTEYIAPCEHLEYMLLPRLAALSEVQWCNADRKDWQRFYDNADRFCEIYDKMGYTYATHVLQVSGQAVYDPEENCVEVTFKAQGDAPVRYTLDGTEPGKGSRLYRDTLKITESCTVTAVALREGIEPKYYKKSFEFHKAMGRNVKITHKTHPKYTYDTPRNLVDGIRGSEIYKCNEWSGWYGKPFEAVIDMEGSEPYSSVTLGTLVNKASYIFNPLGMKVLVSDDGENFTEVASAEYEPAAQDSQDGIVDYTLTFPDTSARYLKVIAQNIESLPTWHHAAGRKGYVFVDEIIVK